MEYNKTELKKYNYLIGQKIKAIRDLKGFKQDYVAEKLGISSGHYSNLENRHKTCTLYILIRLCQILDTTQMNCWKAVFHQYMREKNL